MNHFNYGIIIGAIESAPLLGAYVVSLSHHKNNKVFTLHDSIFITNEGNHHMDEYTKRIRIHKAYNDKAFQKKLKEHRDVIEGKLQAFLDWLQEDSTSSPKILGGLEMRVKSFDSFYEKLDRKDYIHEWDDISENLENNQRIICQKLPDLIGFRLNCYFFRDERNIYNRLKRYYEGGNFSKVNVKPSA